MARVAFSVALLVLTLSATSPTSSLASSNDDDCECEAYRISVSINLNEVKKGDLPRLNTTHDERSDIQAGEESDPNYRGCGAMFVSGKAPSEACGMRWSFGVYMRLPQCPSRYHHACGDWGGHPVYQHVWKTNYLWGDFDMNWFIGTAVGCYRSIYGYIEGETGAHQAEDITTTTWKAWDVDKWADATVRMFCVDPDDKALAVVNPAEATQVVPSATASDADRCTLLHVNGYASVYSKGLAWAFGKFRKLPLMIHGRPAYAHDTDMIYLYSDGTKWVIGDQCGGCNAVGFVNSNATTPFGIKEEPVFTNRRWVGVVPELDTFTPAQVNIDCLSYDDKEMGTMTPELLQVQAAQQQEQQQPPKQPLSVANIHIVGKVLPGGDQDSAAIQAKFMSAVTVELSDHSTVEVDLFSRSAPDRIDVILSSNGAQQALDVVEIFRTVQRRSDGHVTLGLEIVDVHVLLKIPDGISKSPAVHGKGVAAYPRGKDLLKSLEDADAADAAAHGRAPAADVSPCLDDIARLCADSLTIDDMARCLKQHDQVADPSGTPGKHPGSMLSPQCREIVSQVDAMLAYRSQAQRDFDAAEKEKEVFSGAVVACMAVIGTLLVFSIVALACRLTHRRRGRARSIQGLTNADTVIKQQQQHQQSGKAPLSVPM
eukprot:g6345.t1